MQDAVHGFLHGLIDYAGLFPPARLPLADALATYVAARAGGHGWILGRFIVPAARLPELSALLDGGAARTLGGPLPVALIGRGGETPEASVDGLVEDLHAATAFVGRHGAAVAVDVLELRAPSGLLQPLADGDLPTWLARLATAVETTAPVPLRLFIEGSYGPDWHRVLATVVEVLAAGHHGLTSSEGRLHGIGFKLRCGGTEAHLVPPVEQVAQALSLTAAAGIPFKATAGLHHPVRHLDRQLLAKTHGFLNVFVGGVMAHALGLSGEALRELVADEDPRAFIFDDRGLVWQDQRVDPAQVVAARARFATSFGSCSFDEPTSDLLQLGLIERA